MSAPIYDGRYHKFIEKIDQIPSLSVVVSRLLKVVNSSESSAEDVADLIEKDPALTSKVIRLANSAFYGIPRSVSSVQSAVVILGFNTLKSIVLGASVLDLFSSGKGEKAFDRTKFWKHSIVCALAAKAIAQNKLNKLSIDPQSAFCAGIMHDIGKLIFELFAPKEYAGLCARSSQKKIPIIKSELEMMAISHADLGRILADKWALPIDLEHAIVYHHQPQEANKIREFVSLVHMADGMAHLLGCGLFDDETPPQEWQGAREILAIDDAHYESMVGSLSNEMDAYKEFLAILQGA